MMSAVVRVLARAAAIQIEEAAVASAMRKGKGREVGPTTMRPRAQEPLSPSTYTASTDTGYPRSESTPSNAVHDTAGKSETTASSSKVPIGRQVVQEIETIPTSRSGSIQKNTNDHDNFAGVSASTTSTAGVFDSSPKETAAKQRPVSSASISPAISTSPSTPPTTPFSASSPDLPTTPSNPATLDTAYMKAPDSPITEIEDDEDTPVLLRASKVPSSRIGRLFHYGSLAASLSWGAASESVRRSTGSGGTGSVFMSDANIRRLVGTLGRMRGAALKLGQFMSIQDNNVLPVEIQQVLHQVQAHANYMPDWQMEKVMSTELGSDWQSLFSSFDRTPIASASIGQVHKATLKDSDTPVAIKIQFPGISSSITSDLANVSLLLRGSAVLPKGLYLQNTIAVMRRELEDECDYIREADAGRRFSEFLKGDDFFVVPKVVDVATTGKVLTTEWMSGKPLSRMKHMTQETRDKIGRNILRLCLQELFHFRFMQTDPNWANFLYDVSEDKIQLIDFGASREYTKEFMDGWFNLLSAALKGDRKAMEEESLALGYLTGDEEEVMLQAHLDSMALVASPFAHKGAYDFANQTITDSVRALIPVMLKHRLTPPPPETYSLNRKLSGAFLMCARLGAKVDCSTLWSEYAADYKVGPEV
ncbi:ABC1 family-domain-containing protein [Naematelia encephala]|uniref:ABC1 family-domain-containing protein n=1 Tax=Naematelia encephala TaxID=71784 RepID=A0A1Y2BK46_9TREE|nr:ABC1 family-domain-containing protein [Naematelia encephala]